MTTPSPLNRQLAGLHDLTETIDRLAALQRLREQMQLLLAFQQEQERGHFAAPLSTSLQEVGRQQRRLLPSTYMLNQQMPNGFEAGVFYQPRYAVGGDFYWARTREHELVLAIGDATGHGLSGAQLATHGLMALEQTLPTTEAPTLADELEQLDTWLGRYKGLSLLPEEQRESIELALVALSHDVPGQVRLASAGITGFLLTGGELHELKGTRRPLNSRAEVQEALPYMEQTLQLQEGDTLYLLTDGYFSQLGCTQQGLRPMLKCRLLEQMQVIATLPTLAEQSATLKAFLDYWRGNALPQTDDILVMALHYGGEGYHPLR